ncbi:MAG: tandem-95 repeat protein, partial [Gemmataceae bacterium]|nr:tandem-95 repeat protein [Gemmataceae bacterium]
MLQPLRPASGRRLRSRPFHFECLEDRALLSTAPALWISSAANGSAGALSWTDGEVIQFGDPGLAFEPGTTSGTFSTLFDLDAFTTDGNANVTGLHAVSRTLMVGSTNSVTLVPGDVLLSTASAETLGSVVVQPNDVVLFRPTTPGDYSAGTFSILLDNPSGGTITELALVEQATTVGDATLQAGSFLLLRQGAGAEDVWQFVPSDVGAGTTSGTLTELIDGNAINISQTLSNIELITSATTLGDTTLAAGQLLLAVATDDSTVGNNSLAVTKYDIFVLSVTTTGPGTTTATAALFFEGADVGLSATGEEFDALALLSIANQVPTITLPGGAASYVEGNAPTVLDGTATIGDPDSPDFATGLLTVDLIAGGTADDRLAIRNQGTGAGQVGVSGGNVTYEGTVIGTWAGGTDGSTPLVVMFNASADVPAVQALTRNITYQNVSDNPSTAARTVRFVVTDGDGGTSPAAPKTVNVSAVNDAPTLVTNAGATVAEGASVAISAAQLQATDVDNSAAQLTYAVTVSPANGQLELATTPGVAVTTFTQADIDNSRLVYVHNGSETTGDSFTFRVLDGAGGGTGPGTFAIGVASVNDVPIASGESYSTNEDTPLIMAAPGLLANDTDADLDSLTAILVTGPSQGTLVLNSDGSFTYTPNLNFSGTDAFAYRAHDGTSDSNIVTVTLAVAPAAGIVVTPTAGLVITEAGGTATFAVILTSQPTADVIITLLSSSPDSGSVSLARLIFTPANWNMPQMVTVIGGNAGAPEAYTILLAAASSDPAYAGLDPADVSVTNRYPPVLPQPSSLPTTAAPALPGTVPMIRPLPDSGVSLPAVNIQPSAAATSSSSGSAAPEPSSAQPAPASRAQGGASSPGSGAGGSPATETPAPPPTPPPDPPPPVPPPEAAAATGPTPPTPAP